MRTKTTNRDFQPNFFAAYYQNNQLMGVEAWDDEVGKLNMSRVQSTMGGAMEMWSRAKTILKMPREL